MKPSGHSESHPEGGGRPRLIVGISGASGAIYGVRLLQTLRELGIESHLILSRAAEMTISYETDLNPAAERLLGRPAHEVLGIDAACVFEAWAALRYRLQRINEQQHD